MKLALLIIRLPVIFLTLFISLLNSGCSVIQHYPPETCNSQAFVQANLPDYITSRYGSGAPVRLAVIPYSTPANLSRQSDQRPGLSNLLAWQIQSELLRSAELPIVEVLNRQDWPGKKDEFFTGNYGAITQARAAGYDIILVGVLEPTNSIDKMTVYTKVIEVESGITIWYGQTSAQSFENKRNRVASNLHITRREPDQMRYIQTLTNTLANCVVFSILNDELEANKEEYRKPTLGTRGGLAYRN